MAASAPSTRRPGKSRRAKRKASGTPISAESATLAAEIHTLAQSAARSDPLAKKRR
ncbi:MAG TPA: hypothetical protein VFX98_02705 [Longimicrobiaceae bacterium]|nr:hypothetical protein [Longimicrobiaceae bacterium]